MSFNPRVQREDLDASVAYRTMIHHLSTYLKSQDWDAAVIARRNERAKDFPEYVRALFKDAGIERLVLDNGLEPVDFESFRKYAPVRLHRVFRIEPLLRKLLESSKTFNALFDSFDDAIRSATKKYGFSGFKSVIAYRTGLDVAVVGDDEARRSFRACRAGKEPTEWFGPRVKPIRDFLLRHVAERANKQGAFLQIHAGLGDTDIVADRCDPLLLKNFLRLESVSKIPIILIHGGFPYTLEAAWLANVFPNVYFELSTPLPPTFMPALSKARFREALEMVPTTRIVYGSDAHETPEIHWLSAKLAKKALAGAMDDLVADGLFNEDEAVRASQRILNKNALGLLR